MRTVRLELVSDKLLVERVLRGEEPAFRRFYSVYFPRLYRFALHRLDGDADLAEDIVQITMTKALDKLQSYRGEAALFSWLCTFCRHEIGAVLKSQARNPIVLIEDEPAIRAALESLIDPAGTPETEFWTAEVARLIKVTLDSLPTAYGDALEWKYVEGLSVAEIGERLGRGSKATEGVLFRARQAFRDAFVTLASGALNVMLEQG